MHTTNGNLLAAELKFGEDPETAIKFEVKEEAGVNVEVVRVITKSFVPHLELRKRPTANFVTPLRM